MKIKLALALPVLLGIQAAQAQDLFRVPGRPRLVPTGLSFSGTELLATDADGYVYYLVGAGTIGCNHPSDPVATERQFGGGPYLDANGSPASALGAFLALRSDGHSVEAAFASNVSATDRNRERLRVFRFSCATVGSDGAGAVRVGGAIRENDDPLLAEPLSAAFVKQGPDTFCFGSVMGIVCVDLATTPPTLTLVLDFATLDVGLGVDPAAAADAWNGDMPPYSEGWSLLSIATAPDGRIFFVADREYRSGLPTLQSDNSYRHRFIGERDVDGTVVRRFGPVPQLESFWPDVGRYPGWNPLTVVGRLVYSEELRAVIVPVEGNEFDALDWKNGLLGWRGFGLRVIPIDSVGTGYLPISQPIAKLLAQCEGVGGACAALGVTTSSVGALLVPVKSGANPNAHEYSLYELEFDADLLDLDDDGLLAAEERAAGTLDTLPDSDGAGTIDGVEAHLSHTDPTSPGGEPAFQLPQFGRVSYVPSPLIRSQLPTLDYDAMRPFDTRSAGVKGPLCLNGLCYGPSGAVVFRYPVERAIGAPVVSHDGEHITMETAEGLVRFWFSDAREELSVSRADLERFVPAAPSRLHVFPIDRHRTWIASDGVVEPDRFPAVVALATDSKIEIKYDHEKAQRDSGLTVEKDDVFDGRTHEVKASIIVMGYDDVTRQMLIGVRGSWDSYRVGIGADGVTLIDRGRVLAGLTATDWSNLAATLSWYEPPLPSFMLPTGHGDFFTTSGLMEPYGAFRATNILSTTLLDRPLQGIWGDVLLETLCCGFHEDGFFELVRYDESVNPGDLLVLRGNAGSDPVKLHKSGPRGGLAEVWPRANEAIVEIAGLDLAADGSMRLCVADEGSNTVFEFEPAGPRGAPELLRFSELVEGIVDCAYAADGSLQVLARDPSRRLVRAAGDEFAELLVAEEYPAEPEPIEFVHGRGGELETRLTGDGLRGKAYLPDGRVITMREGEFTVRVEGVAVADIPRLVFGNYLSNFTPDFATRVTFRVRPDGLVVVIPHHAAVVAPYATLGNVYVADIGSGGVLELGVGDLDAAHGIGAVVVPGGAGGNPWTGRIGASEPELPEGVVGPAAPSAPTGGENVESSGCSAASNNAGWLALFVVIARLRQARRPRAE
ncbi:MAG: hypothetical protein HY791_14990 [Deltaproteobacteria bacterium]|nr:hypothetical protein [Deltaproteobacteria bacterium]